MTASFHECKKDGDDSEKGKINAEDKRLMATSMY